jgi:hypothetical protein
LSSNSNWSSSSRNKTVQPTTSSCVYKVYCAALDDETLPIINKPKHPKEGNTRNKMEGPTSKKTKEPPKRANYKGNMKLPNPLLSQEAYQIRK